MTDKPSTEETTQPAAPIPPPTSPPAVEGFATSAELAAFVRKLAQDVAGVVELIKDVADLKRLFAVVNENQAGADADIATLREAVDLLTQAIRQRGGGPAPTRPVAHVDEVRSLPRGGGAPVPGGPVLPPVQPAPSAGELPPVQPAPSAGPAVAARKIPGGVEMAIDPSKLKPGQSVDIPGTDIAIRHGGPPPRRQGIGGVAGRRTPGAFRRY